MTENQSFTLRVFFALWPENALQHALYKLSGDLKPVCMGLPARLEMIHLTLAFLGTLPVDRLESLYAAANQVHSPAFNLKIDQIGYWSHSRILWAGSHKSSEGLTNLISRLHAALNNAGLAFDTGKPFVPHISLMRKASCETSTQAPRHLNMQVQEFSLVQSEITKKGANFTVMRRWPLM